VAIEQTDTSAPAGPRGGAPNSASNGGLGQTCDSGTDARYRNHMFAVAELAGRQFGRITWAQLRQLGVPRATVTRWISSGYLLRVVSRVYAVGHSSSSQEASLFEAVLFAGPGACLSHGTAAWWRELLSWPVKSTHISTPREIKTSEPGLKIHCRRELERETVNGLPVTTVTQTMLDLAASESLKLVRHALAQLDYTGRLDLAELHNACGHGRRGSATLAGTLRVHLPELARTRSELEVQFVLLCERYEIPMPLMNRTIHGVEADAWWPDFNLVVELDGDANHRTPAQRNKDLHKELTLRDHGVTVLRYDYHLAMRTPSKVRDDLLSQMRERRPRVSRQNTQPLTD